MALDDPRTRLPAPGVARTRQVVTAARERTPAGVRHRLYQLWSVVVRTVGICMRNRVTGLAAEAAFFAILSLPPLVFAVEFGWYTIVALCFSTRRPRELYLRARKWVDRIAAGAIALLGLRLILNAPKAGI